MNCHERDADLLLLAHNELSAWQRRSVRAHLRRCPRCRARARELAGVSEAFAGAIRESGMAHWSPPAVTKSNFWILSSARLLLVSLVIVIIFVTAMVLRSNLSAPKPPAPASDSGACIPNLPNDRCR